MRSSCLAGTALLKYYDKIPDLLSSLVNRFIQQILSPFLLGGAPAHNLMQHDRLEERDKLNLVISEPTRPKTAAANESVLFSRDFYCPQ